MKQKNEVRGAERDREGMTTKRDEFVIKKRIKENFFISKYL